MANAASLVELKLSLQSDSGRLDCVWKDISPEMFVAQKTPP